MVEKNQPGDAVKNVFKNGRMPTKEEYTKIRNMIDNLYPDRFLEE